MRRGSCETEDTWLSPVQDCPITDRRLIIRFLTTQVFPPPNGVNRAAGLMASCEQDWNLMISWFPGVNFGFSLPINVQIATGSGGASWQDPSGFQKLFGFNPTVVINAGSGTSVNFVRYLLVSEVTEMFMESMGARAEQSSFFQGADEGSMGEGLSRFLGVRFQIANGLGSVPPSGFGVTRLWLNGGRPDFVDNDPDDNKPDPTTGCARVSSTFCATSLDSGYSRSSELGLLIWPVSTRSSRAKPTHGTHSAAL